MITTIVLYVYLISPPDYQFILEQRMAQRTAYSDLHALWDIL
jgi:hypothetical protein